MYDVVKLQQLICNERSVEPEWHYVAVMLLFNAKHLNLFSVHIADLCLNQLCLINRYTSGTLTLPYWPMTAVR